MKQIVKNKSSWKSTMIAVCTLILLLLFCMSCGTFMGSESTLPIGKKSERLDDGRDQLTETTVRGNSYVTGYRNKDNNLHGMVRMEYVPNFYGDNREGVGRYDNGKREGTFKYYTVGVVGDTTYKCYHQNVKIDCAGVKDTKSAEASAYDIFNEKYFWYLFELNAFGFDNDYVKTYLDTVEFELASYEFDESEFYDYYDIVTEELSETPYDSIISFNEDLTLLNSLDNSKDSEFRLAVIDRYTGEGDNLFNIFQTKYPGYLRYLNENEVSNGEYETYCEDFEDLMEGYKPISIEDPLYLDSIDWRMCMTVIALGEEEDKAMISYLKKGINLLWAKKQMEGSLSFKATNSDISTVIIIGLFNYVVEGEILSKAVLEAWQIRQGIARKPTVTTSVDEDLKNTIFGYVHDDGGAEVTERGIVWANTFNPTMGESIEISGSGTGSFTVTLSELIEGTTYFARTYAINNVDTVYGNCVEFVAQGAVSSVNKTKIIENIVITPNPISDQATIHFESYTSDQLVFTLLSLEGKEVYKKQIGIMANGQHHIQMDLSQLVPGIYICSMATSTKRVCEKIIISR